MFRRHFFASGALMCSVEAHTQRQLPMRARIAR
jgi:hypothetical protein